MALIILEYFTSLFGPSFKGLDLEALLGLCEYEVKQLRSLYLMQVGNCKFSPYSHTTWEELFSLALYVNWHSINWHTYTYVNWHTADFRHPHMAVFIPYSAGRPRRIQRQN